MSMVEVKVAELSGAALDWAVATCEGQGAKIGIVPLDGRPLCLNGQYDPFSPSKDWSQGGPLIDLHRLEIVESGNGFACVKDWVYSEPYEWYPVGDTHLIAACRAIVMKASGDTVKVPEELTGTRAEQPGANSP